VHWLLGSALFAFALFVRFEFHFQPKLAKPSRVQTSLNDDSHFEADVPIAIREEIRRDTLEIISQTLKEDREIVEGDVYHIEHLDADTVRLTKQHDKRD